MDAQKIIEQAVDGRYRDELVDLSRQIWELAEVGYEEKNSPQKPCARLWSATASLSPGTW